MVPSSFSRALIATLLVVIPCAAQAQASDYDPQSSAWNGLNELVRLAATSDVELRPSASLDWSEIRRGDGLLVLYPLSHIELQDLSGFLEDGGRLALFDDYGEGAPLFRWFQVTRNDDVHGHARSSRVPGLLDAPRMSDHPLADGVDVLVTNEPVAVFHPRLSPVFGFTQDPQQGVVLAGQVGRGRLVIGGDPSVLINTMLRFPGNRQFARNLLVYLAGRPHGRVYLVHGAFAVHGVFHSRHPHDQLREVVQNLNDALGRLSSLGSDPSAVQIAAILLAVLCAAVLARRTWGTRPSDRFGPTGPSGAAAATAEKISLFTQARANLLYPTLIAKRFFERSLLQTLAIKPPTDVGAVLAAAKGRLDAGQQAEVRAVLVELDQLAIPADEGGPSRIGATRFQSLWRRINAILRALGDR